MARHLVRLKLKLLRAGLKTAGIQGVIGMVLTLVLAVGVGAFGGSFFLLGRVAPDRVVDDLLLGGLGVVFLVWIFGPLVSVGSDSTLEVDQLVLLPLGPRQLMPGLLLASLAGAGGIASFFCVLGILGGYMPVSPFAIVTLLGALLFVAICAASSRLLSTALSSARSRRWRDFALFVGPVLGLGVNLVGQVLSRKARFGAVPEAYASALRLVGRLLPSGPPAVAISAARAGDVGIAVAALIASSLWLYALVALWWRAVDKTLTTAPAPAGPRRSRGARVPGLYPGYAWFLPRDRVGAVAAKELRVLWRDPRQRAAFLASLFPALLPLVSAGALFSRDPRVLLVTAGFGFMVGATATNVYGFDGGRHWMNVAAGDDAGADLAGKFLARVVWGTIVVVPFALALAVRTDGWRMLVPGLLLSAGAFGVASGPALLASVLAPFPMPENRNVFAAGGSGQSLSTAITGIIVLFGGAAVLAPFVLAVYFLHDRPGVPVATSLLAFVVGCLIARGGWALAVRRSGPRQAELLEQLSARHT